MNGLTRKTRLLTTSGPCRLSSCQVPNSVQPEETQAIVLPEEKGLSSGAGGLQAALHSARCRPCPWPRHGQQRKWADVLRWCAGHATPQWPLRAPYELCRGLQDGRGQLQVQRLHRGDGRTVKPSIWHIRAAPSLTEFFFVRRALLSTRSCRRTMKLWRTCFLGGIYGSKWRRHYGGKTPASWWPI